MLKKIAKIRQLFHIKMTKGMQKVSIAVIFCWISFSISLNYLFTLHSKINHS